MPRSISKIKTPKDEEVLNNLPRHKVLFMRRGAINIKGKKIIIPKISPPHHMSQLELNSPEWMAPVAYNTQNTY